MEGKLNISYVNTLQKSGSGTKFLALLHMNKQEHYICKRGT
jgi:hypothetical protein